MINIIMGDYNNFIIMTLIIIAIFIYSNIKNKKNNKINNVKLRFGTIISSVIMALPCTLILKPPILVNELQERFGLNSKNIYPILAVATAIIFIIVIKFIYVPINKDKK